MRKYLQILAMIALLGSICSCTDQYFEKETSSNISDKDLTEAIAKNGELANGLVAGMYSSTLRSEGGGSQDCFGQKSVDLSSDIMSGDMCIAANAYGWFYGSEELKCATVSGSRTSFIWTYYYKLIRSANDVLMAFPSETEVPEEGAIVWAQAKTMRAYAYYNLAYLFSKGYNVAGDNSEPCVILYTSKEDEAKGLNTCQEVWDFVKADLEQSVPVLNEMLTAPTKTEISGSIANGLLAYTYLAMGDYSKAITCADKAKESYSIMTAQEATGGFNSVAKNPSWMWGINITKENTGGLNSWWGHVDIYTYGYAGTPMAKTIDDNLYAQIKDNDIRKYQFKQFRTSGKVAGWKFYHENRMVDGDRLFESDIHFMRASEMLLIKAEAKARLGQDASSEINELLSKRSAQDGKHKGMDMPDSATGTPVYGSSLDDVYLQWRIEMWGEGQGLIIMKRFKKSITRGNNHGELKGMNVSYNDTRLTFPIPDCETNDNILID